jgi:FdhD protein
VIEASRARPAESVLVTTLGPDGQTTVPDLVVGEEPMEIRVGGPGVRALPVAVTMRTPGDDFELAVGFLLAEGVLGQQEEIRGVRYCDLPEGDPQHYNVVTVASSRPVDVLARRRASPVSASCGICGTATLEDLGQRCPPVAEGPAVPSAVLLGLPDRLRQHQQVFDRTGGLHAAGLFTPAGDALAVREDIGRHNAVDKLIGWAALQRRLPLSSAVLVVSGRVSFEIVQKAAVAGVAMVVAVSAPSSLAVATAQRLGITLAGFVRAEHANLYTHPERVVDQETERVADPRPEVVARG